MHPGSWDAQSSRDRTRMLLRWLRRRRRHQTWRIRSTRLLWEGRALPRSEGCYFRSELARRHVHQYHLAIQFTKALVSCCCTASLGKCEVLLVVRDTLQCSFHGSGGSASNLYINFMPPLNLSIYHPFWILLHNIHKIISISHT